MESCCNSNLQIQIRISKDFDPNHRPEYCTILKIDCFKPIILINAWNNESYTLHIFLTLKFNPYWSADNIPIRPVLSTIHKE